MKYRYWRAALLAIGVTGLVCMFHPIQTLLGYPASKILIGKETLAKRPPHIVFILADDLGWGDVSWHNPKIMTPNLEKLARSGIMLNYSYVAPVCSPTRAALLTGRYPHMIGLQNGVINSGGRSLPLTMNILPEMLREQDYATHIIGKWHLGFCSWNHTPTYRGFDSFFGFYNGHESYYEHMYRGKYDFNLNKEIYNDTKKQYSTYLFRDRAIDIIKKHTSNQPLFMYLPFQAVHGAATVPLKYSKMYPDLSGDRAIYSGMVTAMDDAVGDVVNALEERGFLDNLLMVFMSDNGGRPNKGGSNWPLRGEKNTLWEGGTRSVSFVYSKTLFDRTSYVSNNIINAADWLPTLLRAAGSTASLPEIDGVNQWEVISKGAPPVRNEHVYHIDGRSAIRIGKYKLIKGDPGIAVLNEQDLFDNLGKAPEKHNGWVAPEDIGANRTRYGKAISNMYHLYDLDADPLEEVDISQQNEDIVKKLRTRLQHHMNLAVPLQPLIPMPRNFRKLSVVKPGWCDE